MTKAPRIPVAYPDTKLPLVSVSKSDTNARSGTYHLHTDVDWEIWFIAAGQVCLRVSGRPWRLRAGQLLVVGPDEPHALVSGSGKWYTLIFRQRLLQGLPCQARGVTKTALDVAGTRLSGKLTLGTRQGANLDYLLDRLERESFGNEPTKAAMCKALLAQLLLEFARSGREQGRATGARISPVARETVEQLCALVQADLSRPWTLRELVKRGGYGSSQLSYLFAAVTGLSPGRWLRRERIRRACERLAGSDRPATEIAVEVGYGSRLQFYRAFRSVMGTSPSRYRAVRRHAE